MSTPHDEKGLRANFKNPQPADPAENARKQKASIAGGGKALNSNAASNEKSIRVLNK